MSDGYYAMHRGWMDHPVFKGEPYSRAMAWCWLIEAACWKPSKIDIKGRIISLERGQLSYSVRYLADAWGWPKSVVDRFIGRLKTETMIRTDSGTGQLIITICNYDRYQSGEQITGTVNGTHSGTGAGQERDRSGTNKNKENKDNNLSVSKDTAGSVKAAIWKAAVPIFVSAGVSEANARSFIGQQNKIYGEEAIGAALIALERAQPVDPKGWMVAALQSRAGQRNGHAKPNLDEIFGKKVPDEVN